MEKAMNKTVYIGLSTLAAFAFGFLGLFSRKLSGDYGLSMFDISFLRVSIPAVILFIILFFFKRSQLRIKAKHIPFFIIFGLFKIGSDVAYFYAQTHSSLALASLLELTSPYFVIIFSLFLFKENITVKKILSLLLGIVGCILATGIVQEISGVQAAGVVAGIISGVCYSLYFIGSKESENKGYEALTSIFFIFLFASLISLPFVAQDIGTIASLMIQPIPLLYILIFAILLSFLPFLFIMISVREIGSTVTSVICLFEVIFASLVGYFFFGEELGTTDFIGFVLVILSIVLININFSGSLKSTAIGEKMEAVVVNGDLPSRIMAKLREKISR